MIVRSVSSRNASFSKERPRHRRFDEGRRQRVDADLVRRELDRHRLGEAFHRVLGGAIDRAASAPPTWPICDDMLMIEPGRFGLDQPPRHRLRHEKGGAHVERRMTKSKSSTFTSTNGAGRLVPALLTRMSNGCLRGDRLLHGLDVAHVERERRRPAARARGLPRPLPRSPLCARGQRDMRAGIGQRRGRRKPDAAPGAGHQRALAVEAEGGRLGQLDASFRRLRVGHVAAAVAAHADIGLLGVAEEAFQHAQPRADIRRSWRWPRRSAPSDRCRS